VSELDHSRADALCTEGLHAFENGVCRDCGAKQPIDIKAGIAREKSRTAKQFLLTIEYPAEQTRWLYNDTEVARELAFLARTVIHAQTDGAIPQVTCAHLISAGGKAGRDISGGPACADSLPSRTKPAECESPGDCKTPTLKVVPALSGISADAVCRECFTMKDKPNPANEPMKAKGPPILLRQWTDKQNACVLKLTVFLIGHE